MESSKIKGSATKLEESSRLQMIEERTRSPSGLIPEVEEVASPGIKNDAD